jgi:hypothetical protein
MKKKYYRHLGYFFTLNDIHNLYDKTAEYVVNEYLKENRCFCEVSDRELDEVSLACFFPTYVKVDGINYAVIRDIDWDIKELENLDEDSNEDNEFYDRNPAYIDIYVEKFLVD